MRYKGKHVGSLLVAAASLQDVVIGLVSRLLVVDTRYHSSFGVASFTFHTFFKDEVIKIRVACVHMGFPCSSFVSGEGRNNCVLRSLAPPWGVNNLEPRSASVSDRGQQMCQSRCGRAHDVFTLQNSSNPRTSSNLCTPPEITE